MMIKRFSPLILLSWLLLPYIVCAQDLPSHQTNANITVSGFTYDEVARTPLEGTGVFFYRVSDEIEIVTHSNSEGFYSTSIPQGIYVVRALKYGYLASLRKAYDFETDTDSLDFGFTAPVFSSSRDSVVISATGHEVIADTIFIENTGTGELFFSAAPATTENELIILSKRSGNLRSNATRHIFESVPLSKPDQNARINAPADSAWQLLHQDPEDNKEGTLDIDETWVQVKENQLYLKVTFHHPIQTAFSNFMYSMEIDADGNRDTGHDGGWGWIGSDYAIAISDFGSGPMAIVARAYFDQWNYVSTASYSRLDSSAFICGFPLSIFGNTKMLSFMSNGRNLSHPETDIDHAPDYNTGFLIFAAKENSGINLNHICSSLDSSAKDTLVITVDPSAYPQGISRSYILFSSNQSMKPFRLIPIVIDIPTGISKNELYPQSFQLYQNFPNPFNPKTVIGYHLPAGQAGLPVSSLISLRVYDMLGREVAILVNEVKPAGSYSVQWNAQGMPSGVYFYRLQSGKNLKTRKLIILR